MEFDSILYLAKPTYGGWVTFTVHLSLLKQAPIYKICKRSEKKTRDFGYNLKYQNLSLDDFKKKQSKVLIAALDKNYYHLLPHFKNSYLVLHDPTEIKPNNENIHKYINDYKIITIRETMQKFLLNQQIKSKLLYHPYVPISDLVPLKEKRKYKTVSISRIDYDKNTDILLKANNYLLSPIEIYGKKNDRYVFLKLKDLDPMVQDYPSSNYKGNFSKSFIDLANILIPAKFVVDLSKIKNDGGGTQYTFLEAIDFNCALILHEDWVKNGITEFINGYNCFTVKDENDLVELLNNNPDTTKIVANAKKLLKKHTTLTSL